MKGVICMLLSALLFCLLICAAELPPTALPARQSLICPGMLGKPDGTERVTFVWPALTWLRGIFLVNS